MFKMNPMCLFNAGFVPFVIPVSLQTGFYTTLLSGEGMNALIHSAAGKEKEIKVKELLHLTSFVLRSVLRSGSCLEGRIQST